MKAGVLGAIRPPHSRLVHLQMPQLYDNMRNLPAGNRCVAFCTKCGSHLSQRSAACEVCGALTYGARRLGSSKRPRRLHRSFVLAGLFGLGVVSAVAGWHAFSRVPESDGAPRLAAKPKATASIAREVRVSPIDLGDTPSPALTGVTTGKPFVMVAVAYPNAATVWPIYRYPNESTCREAMERYGTGGVANLLHMDPAGIARLDCRFANISWGSVRNEPSSP